MLRSLHIQNIALIDDIEVEIGEGLNILSGETGAGKSIIIDSLNFVLGERADKTLIRYGEECATVEAVFEGKFSDLTLNYLADMGYEAEDTLILRRVMSVSGRNECRVNGRAVTLSMLKGLTETLVDIYGQHEHQSLLKSSNHLSLLDGYGCDKIAKAKAVTAEKYKAYSECLNNIAKFGDMSDRERRMDVLSYQIDELERAELKLGEEDNLIIERKKYRNIEKIINNLREAESILNGYENHSVLANINSAKQLLSSVSDFDSQIAEIEERLDNSKIEIKDIDDTLSNLLDNLCFDDRALERLENRLEVIRALQKKYGGSVESALEFYNKAKEEYTMLEGASEAMEKLEMHRTACKKELEEAADKLSALRKQTALRFKKAISKELADVGMGGSTFSVAFAEVKNKISECGEKGYDKVEFLISPNVGEPLKPLAKIISGGEMSRFMLALKNIVAGLDGISTMVFDEIDTGISGKIAQVVAEKLFNISVDRQVIAVTHLPQLASMADKHFLIEKAVENGKTNTHLTLLDRASDIVEIARLIGGSDIGGHALPHAEEMKVHSDEYKESIRN